MDGIERDLAGAATVVRVDLLSESGREIARRYGVEFTPTFLFFDRGGVLVETTRRLDRDAALILLRS